MALLGIDLGGTKMALAVVSSEGKILSRDITPLENRKGDEVGKLMAEKSCSVIDAMQCDKDRIESVGISVPGISHQAGGTVWAPNIPGWDNYPLLEEMRSVCGVLPVTIDSDRACYILGEAWQGNARGCRDAIYLSVGTGIGAGVLINGVILRGSNDIAGCVGWMALQRPYDPNYAECGCFEYHASGEGIGKVARRIVLNEKEYAGELRNNEKSFRASDVFDAYRKGDAIALKVIEECICFWGMAVANLVSLFNPEKIVIGGGVFGPGIDLLDAIKDEASKWAQPVGMGQVVICSSSLGGDAGVIGAAYLAMKMLTGISKF